MNPAAETMQTPEPPVVEGLWDTAGTCQRRIGAIGSIEEVWVSASNGLRQAGRRVAAARDLRRRMTPAELALWDHLRYDALTLRFRRQHGIGPFVVDFCCLPVRLVVELDGGVHELEDVREQDAWRTAYLQARGFTVLRFPNEQVLSQMDIVLAQIRGAIDVATAHA